MNLRELDTATLTYAVQILRIIPGPQLLHRGHPLLKRYCATAASPCIRQLETLFQSLIPIVRGAARSKTGSGCR